MVYYQQRGKYMEIDKQNNKYTSFIKAVKLAINVNYKIERFIKIRFYIKLTLNK